LCVAVDQKFGRDLHHNYMRDLLTIRQTSDVLEYAARFEQAKHRVLVHNRDMGEVFFVQKFIDGLRYNISSAIVLHKPRTVDAALSLALMQEELLETSSRRYQPRSDREFNRFSPRSGSTKSADTATPTPDTKQLPKFTWKDKGEDKIASLRDQRRAQGLCMKCGEKWNRTHRCPKHIPIHILEEVLEAISVDDSQDEAQEAASTSSEEEVLSLSVSAVEGVQGKKTMRLQGLVNNQEVLLSLSSVST
jgi:hypothetical protein